MTNIDDLANYPCNFCCNVSPMPSTFLAAKTVPPMRTPPTTSVEATINVNTLFKASIKFPPYFLLVRSITNETIRTKIIAPMIDGINDMPANEGPQVPRSPWPIHAPIKPATMFAIQPIATPRLVIAPAMAPMIAPMINFQISPIFTYSLS